MDKSDRENLLKILKSIHRQGNVFFKKHSILSSEISLRLFNNLFIGNLELKYHNMKDIG